MLDESEINKLLAELNAVKSEVRDLRGKLNSLDRKKEELFREKRKISSDVYSRIKDAQSFKEKRNSLTDVVKTSKHSREDMEQQVQKLDAEIEKLKAEKHKMLEKLGVENPSMLKKSIKQLEFKIETQALTFDKEKELMKVIAKMRKQYASVKEVEVIEHKLDTAFREIRELRGQLDVTKKIVQHTAKESQKQHIELIESSKGIDELKKKEDEFEQQIGSIKAEMHGLSETLGNKLTHLDSIKKVLGENNVKLKEDQDKTTSEILKQKDEEVQEKIKNKKKLTTEDLLVLQRTMRN